MESAPAIQMRMAGLLLIGIAMFTLDGASQTPVHTLWLPMLMAAGAMLALRNVLAVALAVIALAGIRMQPGDANWVTGIAYPLLTTAAGITAVVLLWRRFNKRVHETRDARQARRQ